METCGLTHHQPDATSDPRSRAPSPVRHRPRPSGSHRRTAARRAGSAGEQRGQSLVEFVIVVPAFLFLLLGIFQFMLIYRAKATLDYAALEAARNGAINGAKLSSIRTGLARGLTPLYATGTGAAELFNARRKALNEARVFSTIEIISPTQAAWDEFAERQYDGRPALPNDSLAFRDPSIGSSGVNVQDANVLKIRVVHYYPMIVPFVDRVIQGFSSLVQGDWRDTVRLRGDPLGNYARIPIEASAIVRMQSPIYDRDMLAGPGGPGGGTGPGGPGTGGPGGPGTGWPDPGNPDPPSNPWPGDPGPPDNPWPGNPDPPVCPLPFNTDV
jgi:hypothetical protein